MLNNLKYLSFLKKKEEKKTFPFFKNKNKKKIFLKKKQLLFLVQSKYHKMKDKCTDMRLNMEKKRRG